MSKFCSARNLECKKTDQTNFGQSSLKSYPLWVTLYLCQAVGYEHTCIQASQRYMYIYISLSPQEYFTIQCSRSFWLNSDRFLRQSVHIIVHSNIYLCVYPSSSLFSPQYLYIHVLYIVHGTGSSISIYCLKYIFCCLVNEGSIKPCFCLNT